MIALCVLWLQNIGLDTGQGRMGDSWRHAFHALPVVNVNGDCAQLSRGISLGELAKFAIPVPLPNRCVAPTISTAKGLKGLTIH
jgi:hypothetical protein